MSAINLPLKYRNAQTRQYERSRLRENKKKKVKLRPTIDGKPHIIKYSLSTQGRKKGVGKGWKLPHWSDGLPDAVELK